LAYIEAIYYVDRKDDSAAINRLNHIVSTFPQSPIANKAATMLDVLSRKEEIKNYLTNLHFDSTLDFVERRVDLDSNKTANVAVRHVNADSIVNAAATKNIDNAPIAVNNNPLPTPVSVDSFSFNPADSQYIMIILDKVDEVYVNETKNAFNRYNRQQSSTQKIGTIAIQKIGQYEVVLVGPFNNAVDVVNYYDNTKPMVATRIIPWLTNEKYSFGFIGKSNLEKMTTVEKVAEYFTFIKNVFPDRFQ
jgi:hypothetical protein